MSHWFVVVSLLTLYLLPTIVAFWRGHASRYAIAFVNVFGGWALLAWFVVLVWALANSNKGHTVIVNVSK